HLRVLPFLDLRPTPYSQTPPRVGSSTESHQVDLVSEFVALGKATSDS
ncbi:MAG: hypothetical protein ACI8QF_002169, partial [Limisphaerales bacterium]